MYVPTAVDFPLVTTVPLADLPRNEFGQPLPPGWRVKNMGAHPSPGMDRESADALLDAWVLYPPDDVPHMFLRGDYRFGSADNRHPDAELLDYLPHGILALREALLLAWAVLIVARDEGGLQLPETW
jgi:hypothetical protein